MGVRTEGEAEEGETDWGGEEGIGMVLDEGESENDGRIYG